MQSRVNPFKPGGIAAPGMFAGRLAEVVALETALLQTSRQNPQHFLVRGERGIGKSSLLLYLEGVASGAIPTLKNDSVRFLVVSIALDRHTTFMDLVRRVGKGLERASRRTRRLESD